MKMRLPFGPSKSTARAAAISSFPFFYNCTGARTFLVGLSINLNNNCCVRYTHLEGYGVTFPHALKTIKIASETLAVIFIDDFALERFQICLKLMCS